MDAPAFNFRSIGYAEVLREPGAELAVIARDNSIDWMDEPKPGGGVYYANPPAGVHTAFYLINPSIHQSQHPTWFGGWVTDASGKKVATQLCWMADGLIPALIEAARTDLRFSVNANAIDHRLGTAMQRICTRAIPAISAAEGRTKRS